MCGIAGIVNFGATRIDLPAAINRLTSAIAHRGPDGEGFTFFSDDSVLTVGGNATPAEVFASRLPHSPSVQLNAVAGDHRLALGHRRLSIIDLSPAGHQPLCSADGNLWITYNGEIYNYIELRRELEEKGHAFFTNTDTEVILNAYAEWGGSFLNRLNGMWAFVIYDRSKQELFGARDRFGVKPFYYYKDKNAFVFASEQKALLSLPQVRSGINPAAVFDYFAKGEIEYEEEGMFRNIMELFPSRAFRMSVLNGQMEQWTWYRLEVNNSAERFNPKKLAEHTERTRELFMQAVALRLRSDVPVGSCLSGGIDSSAIVGAMHQLLGNSKDKLNVFTASFHDSTIDESKWAKLVAERTGAAWHQTFPVAAEFIGDLEDLIYSQDVPIWSTSTYAQYRVMKLASETNTKVVLDGQGGDELYAGYDTYNVAHWNGLLRKGRLGELMGELRASGHGMSFFFKQYMRFHGMKQLPAGAQAKFASSYYDDVQYLDRSFWNEHKKRYSLQRGPKVDSLNNMLYGEFVNTRLKGYLKCEDRCSMRHSVESRTPFADDHLLIEHAFRVPGAYKIHKGVAKYLLREAVKGLLPKAIAARTDKMGYATPNNRWITELKEELRPLFNESLAGFFDVKRLNRDYNRFFSPERPEENGRTFKFISFAVWKKAFKL